MVAANMSWTNMKAIQDFWTQIEFSGDLHFSFDGNIDLTASSNRIKTTPQGDSHQSHQTTPPKKDI